MNRTTALAAALLLACTSLAAAEPVATLSQAEGTVLVNQGEQFVTAAEGQALQAGDRVMLMEGARASLVFTDGCVLPLAEGSLLDVPAVSTCAGGLAQVQSLGPTLAEAEQDAEESKPFLQTPAGIAVVATAVVVVAAAAGGSGGDNPPASP
ncbi:hypothetical protein [Arenimonas sp.]|uniref:hypothetical protein n=1 Tax=Arenimonas sp. TaxID=1872635 RepID=UPI0025F50EFB|nr:hypothetical protein [Arenimonas sp.]